MFPEKRDPRGGGYNNNRSRRDFPNQAPSMGAQVVNSLFKELVYQILEKIKNELYFKWPNKRVGIHPGGIRASIAIIINIEGMQLRTAGLCVLI